MSGVDPKPTSVSEDPILTRLRMLARSSIVGADLKWLLDRYDRQQAALQMLLPGLVLDLRYADIDDDKDAMRSRIETVEEALR